MDYTKYKSSVVRVFFREFSRIMGKKTIYLLSIFLPILLFITISLIYKTELVHKIPVAIYDADHSDISRIVIKYIESTSSLTIVKYCNSVDEIKDEFRKGNIHGAFAIPKDLEKTIKGMQTSGIVVYQDGTNLILSNYLFNDGAKIVKTVNAGIILKKLKSKSIMESQAMTIVNPVHLDTQILYNPNYSYESYLAPGIIIALFQMIIMTVGALVFASEFEHKTFAELVETSNGNIFAIIVGKVIPHFLIHFCSMLFMVGIVFQMFNIRYLGSYTYLILIMSFFILTSILFSFAISVIMKDQQTATEVVMFLNTPAFIFSGFTFPLWSMPMAHNLFAQIIPFTHFLSAYLKIFTMGLDLNFITSEMNALLVFCIVSIIAMVSALLIALKKMRKAVLNEAV